MSTRITEIFDERQADRYDLHAEYLNEQMVRVLRAIGYDVGFRHGSGQYLYDREGTKYLDLLSGFGVFAMGRNHPAIRDALKDVLDADLPERLKTAFAKHPKVERVDKVTITPPKRVRVDLVLRK